MQWGQVAVQSSDGAVWLDLTLRKRTGLNQVLEHYDVPREVATYFFLRYQSPKVIHAELSLFMIIFLATPSLRHIFSLWELKICLTPTLVATVCEPFVHAKPNRDRLPPLPPPRPTGSVEWLLSDLLGRVLSSYETVVKTIADQSFSGMEKEERQLWRQRVEKFAEVLHGARLVMSHRARAERRLALTDGLKHFAALATRLETLIRTIEDILRRTHTDTGRS
jgi:Mg2+ and Co2+ transporter CorA